MIEKAISEAARDVLAHARVEGNILYLPLQQLERKLYEEVNEVLTRLGGKWKGGKVKGHIFDSDPSADLEVIVATGYMPAKNPTAFFATPTPVILDMLHNPELPRIPQDAKRILEPSAGTGAIATQVMLYCKAHGIETIIDCCEIVPKFQERLREQGFTVVADDFLTYHGECYDAIFMNPPFSVEGDQLAYITHIMHAYDLLAPHGVLIAIAPPGFTFRGDKKSQNFRALVESDGTWQKLPPDSFKESGTGIETTVLTLVKSTIQDRAERLVENAQKSVQVAEKLRALVGDETMLRARNIPAIVPDEAYELTRAIEQAEAKRMAKDVPVFGDPRWISKAKKKAG